MHGVNFGRPMQVTEVCTTLEIKRHETITQEWKVLFLEVPFTCSAGVSKLK